VKLAAGRHQLGAAFIWFTCIALAFFAASYLVLDHTVAGQAWSDQAYLGSALQPGHARSLENHALHLITPMTTGLACAILVLVAGLRRQIVVGLVAAFGLGLAALLAEVLRVLLPHPDLATGYEALMGGKTYQTFPSGHATIATAATLALLLVVAPQLRTGVAIAGAFATTLVAAGTVAATWHRPGDALGGVALACTVQGICAWFLVRRYGRVDGSPTSSIVAPIGCASAAGFGIVFYLSDVRLVRVGELPSGVHAWAFPSAIAIIGIAVGVAVYGFSRLLRGIAFMPRG